MSQIKYVIRSNNFAYSDEWYYDGIANLGDIHTVYDDKTEAELKWRALVVAKLRRYGLFSYELFIETCPEDFELVDEIEAFVLQACGHAIYDGGDVLDYLNDDEVFEIAQRSEIMHYQLLAFDVEQPIYALWFTRWESYLRAGEYKSLVYERSADFIDHDDDYRCAIGRSFNSPLKGTLAELSDSPQLLEALIQTTEGISYDAEQQELSIANTYKFGFNNFKALNALLKQPVFEIRQLSLAQIQVLEQAETQEQKEEKAWEKQKREQKALLQKEYAQARAAQQQSLSQTPVAGVALDSRSEAQRLSSTQRVGRWFSSLLRR